MKNQDFQVSTFSTFLFEQLISLDFFFHLFVGQSVSFWSARFGRFGSILGIILDGIGFNFASKTLQEAFQEAFKKNIKFRYPSSLFFGCFGTHQYTALGLVDILSWEE